MNGAERKKAEEMLGDTNVAQKLYQDYHRDNGQAELKAKIDRLKKLNAPQGYIKKLEDKLNK